MRDSVGLYSDRFEGIEVKVGDFAEGEYADLCQGITDSFRGAILGPGVGVLLGTAAATKGSAPAQLPISRDKSMWMHYPESIERGSAGCARSYGGRGPRHRLRSRPKDVAHCTHR